MEQLQNMAPEEREKTMAAVERFIQAHPNEKIALVTSGGTRVKLDPVRSIENFSMGTRGAASAEYFLKLGYAVIFFHREGSLKPFSRKYLQLFDHLQVDDQDKVTVSGFDTLPKALREWHNFKQHLLLIPFVDVDQYLQNIVTICSCLEKCGSRVLIYLAAAVSDFTIQKEKLPTHKIQSQNSDLQLHLSIVPKILERLINEVVPNAYVVSFKLETDERLLIKKARDALKKYRHNAVIGNLLQSRKRNVVFIFPDLPNMDVELGELEEEIESKIVNILIQQHSRMVELDPYKEPKQTIVVSSKEVEEEPPFDYISSLAIGVISSVLVLSAHHLGITHLTPA